MEVYRQLIRLGAKPLEVTSRDFCLQLNPSGHNPHLTSPLMRDAFVKCTYRTYSMLLKILALELYKNPLSVQALQSSQVLVFISPRKRVAQLYLQALGSFSSPPTTSRAKMKLLEPAYTRESHPLWRFLSADLQPIWVDSVSYYETEKKKLSSYQFALFPSANC
jgi:hypothetical protein